MKVYGSVTVLVAYSVLLVNAFRGDVFQDLVLIDAVNIHHMAMHHGSKRSVDMSTGLPYTIHTQISGDLYDITLKFNRKHDRRMPNPIIHYVEGDSVTRSEIGFTECSILYEDDVNFAHAIVDPCQAGKSQFKMIAEVYINGSQHVILPSSGRGSPVQEQHRLYSVNVPVDFQYDYPVIDKDKKGGKFRVKNATKYKKELAGSNTRYKREVAGSYVVELMFVIDYSLYQFWYGITEVTSVQRSADALELIQKFYSFVANGVDLRLKTLSSNGIDIRAELVNIYVLQTSAESSFTENNPGSAIDSATVLTQLAAWVAVKKQSDASFPKSDHVMLLTGRDLSIDEAASAAGYANVGEICTDASLSIVEGRFNFLSVVISAHELGHSLGASHDGEGNTCNSDDGYILATSNQVMTGAAARNPWYFSTCSVASFTTQLLKLNTVGTNCLVTNDNSVNIAASGLPPGQIYPPDKQCEHMYGAGSELARVKHRDAWTEICTGVWCGVGGINVIKLVIPADGTTCGDQMWCMEGKCVPGILAPVADNTCLFGDQPGEYVVGSNCTKKINANLANCYTDAFRDACCTSCAAKKLDTPGCEYGDIYDCSQLSSSQCYNETYSKSICCNSCQSFARTNLPEDCKYGDKNPTCARNLCQQYPEICCETCVDVNQSTTRSTSRDTVQTTQTPAIQTTKQSDDSSLPSWVIPVAAGVGGAFVIGLIVAMFCCCRSTGKKDYRRDKERRRRRHRDENRSEKPRRTRDRSYSDLKPSSYDNNGMSHPNGYGRYSNPNSYGGNHYSGNNYARY